MSFKIISDPKLKSCINFKEEFSKNIIFDLGGVLIDWNPDYVFKKLINLFLFMFSFKTSIIK